MAIRSFRDDGTHDIANDVSSKAARRRLPPTLHDIAYRKLVFLDNARSLVDLTNWQSLRLEKLRGDRRDQYSIRINNRYRICFRWAGTDALDVEVVDYH